MQIERPVRSGCCRICGRALKNAKALEQGIGPVCARKQGIGSMSRPSGSLGDDTTYMLYDGGDIMLRRTSKGHKIVNVPRVMIFHSPDGFDWGYGGSGPSDLALNIMLMFLDKMNAFKVYQDFKATFITNIPFEGGNILRRDIDNFLNSKIVQTQ
jgi:hypothetical protein